MNLNADDAQRLAEVLLGADPQGPAAADESEPEGRLSPGPFGRYQITRLVGAGGMGEVYEAQQESPARRVAIKVVRPGLLSGEVLRRFEHETRILARLEHPGIAPIFEAGRVDTGAGSLPFFAMEYVDGRPLTEFAAKLPLRARLELFLKVCDAVEHAHRKGVIHRDLKPGNILVDEGGRPRVMDFGVARATDSDIRATSMGTELGRLLGTLPYMSPEQVGGDPDELDTRSDVYSLGVVLYELLGGRLPYNLKGEGRGRIPEAVRAIQESEPAPLSSIDRIYRGDLDTIVAKALAKERSQRYQSVGDLGGDVRRYLSNEPIVARRPSARYQAAKFAKRNRGLVVGLLVTLLGLSAGFAVAIWQATRAIEALRISEASEAQARSDRAEAQRRQAEAERQTAIAKSIMGFFREAIRSVDPRTGSQPTVQQILESTASQLDSVGADAPEVEAELSNFVGVAYAALGLYERSIPYLERALELDRRTHGVDAAEAAVCEMNLADALRASNRLAEAAPLLEHALVVLEKAHDGAATAAQVRIALSRTYEQLADFDRALGLISAEPAGNMDPSERERLVVTFGLQRAAVLTRLGRAAEAVTFAREAVARAESLREPDEFLAVDARSLLGGLLLSSGRSEEAVPVLENALEAMTRTLGEKHPTTIHTRASLGNALSRLDKPQVAETHLSAALEASLEALGDRHPETLDIMHMLSNTLRDQMRTDEAESLLRRLIPLREEAQGIDHPSTIMTVVALGQLLRGAQREAEARPLLEEGLRRCRTTLGDRHPSTLFAMYQLADTLVTLGERDSALSLAQEHLTAVREGFGPETDEATVANILVGRCHRADGGLDRARQYFEKAVAAAELAHDREHGLLATALWHLGGCQAQQGELVAARATLERALRVSELSLGLSHARTSQIVDSLATCLASAGEHEAAAQIRHDFEARKNASKK